MRRREFIARAGVGSVALASLPLEAGAAAVARETVPATKAQGGHMHETVSGPLATATVSFGQWAASGLDRYPNLGAPAKPNGHLLIPYETTIKAGGTVNFMIAGFHHVLVYGPGVQPEDINAASFIPLPGPPGLGLIDDPTNRVYRGLDPTQFPQDRIEVVQFPNAGTYLAVCGVTFHFADKMWGWVKVNP